MLENHIRQKFLITFKGLDYGVKVKTGLSNKAKQKETNIIVRRWRVEMNTSKTLVDVFSADLV